jgi:hypothetical protein
MKATFVLKWLEGKRPNRKRPQQTVELDALLLGSRGNADLFVQDRWVAGQALWLRPALGGLSLQPVDQNSLFAGAFLDGVPISGHEVLYPGSVLQVGQVAIAIEKVEDSKYVLTIDEGYLHAAVQKATDKEAGLSHEEAQESLWGKYPRFVRANKIAGLIGLGLLLIWPFFTDTEIVTRGPLSWSHASTANADFIAEHRRVHSCDTCHGHEDGLNGSCLSCHADFQRTPDQHPYDKEGIAYLDCIDCHREHLGLDTETWPEIHVPRESLDSLRQDPPQVLAAESPTACVNCHPLGYANSKSSPEAIVLGALESWRAKLPRDKAEPVKKMLALASFSHRDHLAPRSQKAVACQECHKPADGRRHYQEQEFLPVTYEDCMRCHEQTFQVDDHGANSSDCLKCHKSHDSKELKELQIPAGRSLYSFSLVGGAHDVTSEDCNRCHIRGEVAAERKIEGKPFRHDVHLETTQDGTLLESAAIDQCWECHGKVAQSKSLSALLVEGRLPVDLQSCEHCHGEQPTVSSDPQAAVRTVKDMFHVTHTTAPGDATKPGLENSCLSCHKLGVDGITMAVDEEKASCTNCHGDHQNVGCTDCHFDTNNRDFIDRVLLGSEQFPEASRNGVHHYRHSSPGHEELDCTLCHGEMTNITHLRSDQERGGLKLPSYDDHACQACHLIARYHR